MAADRKKPRDTRIDFLRGVSIILILLIHVLARYTQYIASFTIWDYLHFVESLLIFCSGASLAISHPFFSNSSEMLGYAKKRLSRLLVPWWIFVTIFLAAHFAYDMLQGAPFRYGLDYALKSYLLFGIGGGIGYGWILGVILMLSILYPMLLKLFNYLGSQAFLGLVVCSSLLLHLLYSADAMHGSLRLIYYLQYALPFCIGIYYALSKDKKFFTWAALFAAVYFLLRYLQIGSGHPAILTYNKYPPNLYFISYGAMAISLLLLLSEYIHFPKDAITGFFSRNSLWIYQWHILGLGVFAMISRTIGWEGELYSIPGFFIVAGMSAAAVIVQGKMPVFLKGLTSNNKLFK